MEGKYFYKEMTMGFSTINQHAMTNNDHFQFNKQALFAVDKAGVEFLHAEEYRDKYAAAIEQEDGVINKIYKSALTDDIAGLNTKRNDMIFSCSEITKSYLRHPDEKKQKAAKNLEILWNTNKNLPKLSLTAKTSGIYNMLQDLDGKYKEDAELLGLDEFIENMRKYNNELEILMDKRFDESAEKVTISVKEARLITDSYLDKIIDRIYAYINIEGVAKYQDFINRLNVVIAKYSTGKGKKPTAQEETPETPKEPITPPVEPVDYPDAIEWEAELQPYDVYDGAILYHVVDGEKVYYKLLNSNKVGVTPGTDDSVWEKL